MQVQRELEIYDEACKYYKEYPLKILDQFGQNLCTALHDELAKVPDLQNHKSVYETWRFQVKARAKSPASLREKLVRSSEGLDLIRELGLTGAADVAGGNDALCAKLLGAPDALGVKVLCDLKIDAEEAYRLLQSLGQSWQGVVWREEDLLGPAQKMKNNRPIYRIKGKYTSSYRSLDGEVTEHCVGLELQIKSRLDDVWGEIDHPLFYKNHSYSPVRAVLEMGMRHVAGMLDSIDQSLMEIRTTASSGVDGYDGAYLLTEVHRLYDDSLKDLFQHDFSLEPIHELLVHASKHMVDPTGWITIAKQGPQSLVIVSPDGHSPLCEAFKVAIDRNYHVAVLFSIIKDWHGRLASEWNDEDILKTICAASAELVSQAAGSFFTDVQETAEMPSDICDTVASTLLALPSIGSILPATYLQVLRDPIPYASAALVHDRCIVDNSDLGDKLYQLLFCAYLLGKAGFEFCFSSLSEQEKAAVKEAIISISLDDELDAMSKLITKIQTFCEGVA